MWRVAANILNKKWRTADRGWFCSMGLDERLSTPHRKNCTCYEIFKRASFRREEVDSILIEFGTPRKLVGLIKTCLIEAYTTVCIGENVSDKFPIQNGLK
jgi:hypothetical protein